MSKGMYKLMVWGCLGIGLLINLGISHLFINSGVTENQMRLGFWMAISLIVVGFGMGLSVAHSWEIR